MISITIFKKRYTCWLQSNAYSQNFLYVRCVCHIWYHKKASNSYSNNWRHFLSIRPFAERFLGLWVFLVNFSVSLETEKNAIDHDSRENHNVWILYRVSRPSLVYSIKFCKILAITHNVILLALQGAFSRTLFFCKLSQSK